MRTKHFLTALCLPLAFAACTNEDFLVEGNTLESRGKIDVMLTAEKAPWSADTKLGIDADGDFLWEKGTDLIGAALVDGAELGTVGNNIYVNYPFTADSDGRISTFSGKSSMTMGQYFFYYEYKDVLDKNGLPMGMPDQEFDVASKKTAKEQAANYMVKISPIVNLAKGLKFEDAQSYNLNLKFEDLYTFVGVKINSKNIPAGTKPTVKKIALDAKDASGNSAFKTNAAMDMTKVEEAGIISLDDKGQIKSKEQADALAELKKMIADGSIYSGNQADLKTLATTGAFEVRVKGDLVLENGKETVLYILVPKGTYKSIVLNVETSEGVCTIEPDAKDIEFAVTPRTLKAELDFAENGNVKMDTEFKIGNAKDWDNAITFMKEHSDFYIGKAVTFTLTDNVEINELPKYTLTVKGNYTLTLAKDATIGDDCKVTFSGAKLGVKEGATVTLNEAVSAEIENFGTLNVNKNLTGAVSNYGTLKIAKDVTFGGDLVNGRVENKAKKITAKAGTIQMSNEITVTVTGVLNNVNGKITIPLGTTLKVNGNSSINDVDGTIVVNKFGELAGTGTGFTNIGTIDNAGTLSIGVTNSKTISTTNETVNGKFIVQSSGKIEGQSVIVTGGVVEVKDVENFTGTNSQYTGKVTAVVSNAAEYKLATTGSTAINDVTLNGGVWTLTDATVDDATSKDIAVANNKDLTLNGVTLKVTEATATVNITAGAGTSTIEYAGQNTGTTITGNVTVAAGANLTVKEKVTVNATTTNAQEAVINGNLTVNAGAKMYFKEATVAKGATLTVSGKMKDGTAQGEFGVIEANFVNNGTINIKAGTDDDKTSGACSAPKTGEGTIVGTSSKSLNVSE